MGIDDDMFLVQLPNGMAVDTRVLRELISVAGEIVCDRVPDDLTEAAKQFLMQHFTPSFRCEVCGFKRVPTVESGE